jgi:linoleoyl-CoA desaturase
MSLLCNPIMWQHQHTYAHHSHTNDSLHDPDLHHFDILLRVHRRCKYKGLYKHQTNLLWVILAYSLVVFGTCIKIPLSVMTTGFIYGMVENTDRKRRFRAFSMLVHYVAYLGMIVIAPFFSGKSWGICSLCVLIHLGVAGLLFAFFSQINHLNEQSLENKQITDGKVPQSSWAVNQVITSNNFAMDSIFWHYFSNGLNMQIEHHLFPGLNHCHLHLVAPIVKATCDEYRVPYKSYDSWTDIMKATLRWLDVLSTDDTK